MKNENDNFNQYLQDFNNWLESINDNFLNTNKD